MNAFASRHLDTPYKTSPLPSANALALEQMSVGELETVFVRGATPDLEALVGWEFRGINHLLGLGPVRFPLANLVGIKKFVKGFFRTEDGRATTRRSRTTRATVAGTSPRSASASTKSTTSTRRRTTTSTSMPFSSTTARAATPHSIRRKCSATTSCRSTRTTRTCSSVRRTRRSVRFASRRTSSSSSAFASA